MRLPAAAAQHFPPPILFSVVQVMNELAERGETKNYSFSVLTKILKPGGWG